MCHGLLLSYTFSFKVLVRMQIPHCVLFQITESLASGAKKVCFQQFASAKDFPTFVSDFWSLGKRDQDTLVPHSIFNQIFVWLKKTCFKRVQIYLRVLRQKGNQPVLPQNIWFCMFLWPKCCINSVVFIFIGIWHHSILEPFGKTSWSKMPLITAWYRAGPPSQKCWGHTWPEVWVKRTSIQTRHMDRWWFSASLLWFHSGDIARQASYFWFI